MLEPIIGRLDRASATEAVDTGSRYPVYIYEVYSVAYAEFWKGGGGGGGAKNFRKFKNKDQNKKLFHPKSVRFFAQI